MHLNDKKYPGYRYLTFRVHALRAMFQRRITDSDVRELIGFGAIIEEYPDDTPYPSFLVAGTVNNRPLHVVMAYNNLDRGEQLLSQHTNRTRMHGLITLRGGNHEVRNL